VTIPGTITARAVTSIGDDVFYNCTSLFSVTIPNSIARIGYGASKCAPAWPGSRSPTASFASRAMHF